MSAGPGVASPAVVHTLDRLAPKFREAIIKTLMDCPDAIVFETYRSRELAQLYYARGRTVKPPAHPVTNAPDNTYSWHGYGAACDIIHKTLEWGASRQWFESVAEIAKSHGCKWGGDWKQEDLPHFQWHKCKASPSDEARRLLRDEGMEAVWRAIGAA